jgi:ribosomal protein L37AE/L43A
MKTRFLFNFEFDDGKVMESYKRIKYGRFDEDTCPYCGSTITSYNKYHKDWLCHSCGKYFG